MARKYFGTDGIRGATNAGAMTAAGAVDPTPSLMLVPLGETPIATTSAPSSHSADGATL